MLLIQFTGELHKSLKSLESLIQKDSNQEILSLIVSHCKLLKMDSSPPENQTGEAKLWMQFKQNGESTCVEWENIAIIHHTHIKKRFLWILDHSFSNYCNIFFARDGAIVIQFGFIKAIVTAQELFLLDPSRPEVLPFVEKLREQFPHKVDGDKQGLPAESAEGLHTELPLPFEFQVLKIALEVVCTYLDSSVSHIERVGYPLLDKLARNVSDENLKHVRSLKSDHSHLLVFVKKMLDVIERLLNNNERMAQLYLTRKLMQNKKFEDDVEDLKMLLDEYHIKLTGTHMKMLSLREDVDDKENNIKIVLDDQKECCEQKKRRFSIANLAVAGCIAVIGILRKSICSDRVFVIAVGICIAGFIFLYMVAISRLKHNRL